MNSIFLRIYGGMLVALVLVALLGFLTLHLVNQVRGDEYREGLARGTFRLMADNLQPMNKVERHRALLQWERLLGIPLDVQALDQQPLDSHARERFDAARACCSIGRARSSETTCAFGQRFCIAMLARPVPQPRSSTRCGGSRFNAGSSR